MPADTATRQQRRPADERGLHAQTVEEWVAGDWADALRPQRVARRDMAAARAASTRAGEAHRASLRQDIAGALAWLGVVVMLSVSDHLLTWMGNHYTMPGGNVLEKLHPSTYLIYLAFLVLAVPVNPARYLAAMAAAKPALIVYTIAMIGIMAYCTWRFGISGAAFINESLMMPAVLAMTLFGLPQVWRRRIFLAAIALLMADAAIGLIEYALKARLIPYYISGVPHEEPIFRATALLGHPLKNAAVLATFLCTFMVIRQPVIVGVLGAALVSLSLLAFGSRTAFVACLGVGGMAMLIVVMRSFHQENFSYGRLLGAVMLVLAAPLALGMLYLIFGEESRIAQTLFWDTSAESRLLAFRVFDRVTAAEIVFGVGPEGIDRVLTQLKSLTTLTDIENVWILLLLNFGLISWTIFVFTFGWLLITLLKGAPMAAKAAAVVFIIMSSATNSLAVKDSSMVLLVVAVMGATSYARLARNYRADGYSPSAANAGGSNSRRGFAGSRGTVVPSRYSTSPRAVAMPNRSA